METPKHLGSQPCKAARSALGGWSVQTKAPTKVRPPASRMMPSCKCPSVRRSSFPVRRTAVRSLRCAPVGKRYLLHRQKTGRHQPSVPERCCCSDLLPFGSSSLLFLLLLTARCWLDQCSLPWQPRLGRSRGGGGASRDRASLFPDWSGGGEGGQ